MEKKIMKNLEKLVSIDTSCPENQTNIDVLNFIESILRPLGFNCIRIPSMSFEGQNSLIAVLNPENKKGGILLSGHMDTVKVQKEDWRTDPFRLEIINDKAYGLGTVDMKGFLACVLSVVSSFPILKVSTPLYLSFTYDEETTVKSIEEVCSFFKKNKFSPNLAIVGEPTLMNVADSGKGYLGYTTLFEGKEGHSSYPEKGLNAIYMASEFSEKLKEINEIYKVSTLNVGMIRGGVSPNSIPKNCVVEWEIRPETSSDLKKIQKEVFEKIDNILDKYKGAKSTTEIREKLLPFNYKLKNKTRDICLNSIPKSKAIKGNGAGESGYYQELGMDVVYCGPGNPDFAHKNNEYIQISELKKYCVFLKKILSSQDETK